MSSKKIPEITQLSVAPREWVTCPFCKVTRQVLSTDKTNRCPADNSILIDARLFVRQQKVFNVNGLTPHQLKKELLTFIFYYTRGKQKNADVAGFLARKLVSLCKLYG